MSCFFLCVGERVSAESGRCPRPGRAWALSSPPPLGSVCLSVSRPLSPHSPSAKWAQSAHADLLWRLNSVEYVDCLVAEIFSPCPLMSFQGGTVFFLFLPSLLGHLQGNSPFWGEKQRVSKPCPPLGKISAFSSSLSTYFCSGLFYLAR